MSVLTPRRGEDYLGENHAEVKTRGREITRLCGSATVIDLGRSLQGGMKIPAVPEEKVVKCLPWEDNPNPLAPHSPIFPASFQCFLSKPAVLVLLYNATFRSTHSSPPPCQQVPLSSRNLDFCGNTRFAGRTECCWKAKLWEGSGRNGLLSTSSWGQSPWVKFAAGAS